MTRNKIIRLLTVGLAVFLAGCSETARVNYRVTVEIVDGGVLRSGSGVWSTKITENKSVFTSGFNAKFRGEAIAIDFPGRPTLFVLPVDRDLAGMPGTYVEWIKDIYRNKLPLGFQGNNLEIIREVSRHLGWTYSFKCHGSYKTRKEELAAPPGNCPTFAAFNDFSRPETAISIDPMQLTIFGESVVVQKISVSITEDDVTTGIEKRLAWLPSYIRQDKGLDGISNGSSMYGKFTDMTLAVFFSTELN